MKLAFLDTSVINRCHNLGITGEQFSAMLAELNLEPAIGIYTTYELARDFLNNEPTRTIGLFRMIRDLKPNIVCQRPQMYVTEFNQLESGRVSEAHKFLLPLSIFGLIRQGIDDYCNGNFNEKAFIDGRQESLDEMRSKWDRSKKVEVEKGSSFIEFRDEQLKNNQDLRLGIKQIIPKITNGVLVPRDEDISLLMANLDLCPAFRSLVYSQLYQEFIFAASGNVPAEDRFTDSTQLIEASHCEVYLTHDKRHIRYAPEINPSLDYKLIDSVVRPSLIE